MQPIAAYEEARSVRSTVREFDRDAVLVLLKAYKLVSELDRNALSLRLLDESTKKGWSADTVHPKSRKLFDRHSISSKLALVLGKGRP